MLQMYLRLHVHLRYRRTQHDDTARSDSNVSAQSATKQKVVCAFRCAFLALTTVDFVPTLILSTSSRKQKIGE